MFKRKDRTAHRAMEPGTEAVAGERVPSPIERAPQSLLFTLLGAAALIVSPFLEWVRPEGIAGVNLSYRAYFDTGFGADESFFRSAGAVAIGIGILAILGMAWRSGWITRLAGALGIIAFAMYTVTLYRLDADLPASLGVGTWVMLGGGLLSMFGGFFATKPKIVVRRAVPAR